MAFFEDIGKKLSQSSQGAVQKTRAFADVARMNSAISDEEKKINNAYFQIGKMYAELHPEDYEEDLASLIGAVHASEQRIRALKKQIQEIKGVTHCEKCGAAVDANVAFCSSCGAPMPRPAAPAAETEGRVKCSACGAYVLKGMRFCTTCGQPMTAVSTPADAAAPSPVFAQPTQESPAVKPFAVNIPAQSTPAGRQCPSCGSVMDDDVDFCTECGTRL